MLLQFSSFVLSYFDRFVLSYKREHSAAFDSLLFFYFLTISTHNRITIFLIRFLFDKKKMQAMLHVVKLDKHTWHVHTYMRQSHIIVTDERKKKRIRGDKKIKFMVFNICVFSFRSFEKVNLYAHSGLFLYNRVNSIISNCLPLCGYSHVI